MEGSKKYLADDSIDLIITDPPYGIDGDKLHVHYNRNEEYVIDGYREVSKEDYPEFSKNWIRETERVLRPGGSIYIISGYTNLIHILNALNETSLIEKNHIIWKYNFGVYTEKKFVSSHYHILYYVKPGGKVTFNTNSRYGYYDKLENGNSKLYKDLEDYWEDSDLSDIWKIPKKYKPGAVKNKNELPEELLIKMIQYSSNEDDKVCDFFAGSFSTVKASIGLKRIGIGFEVNKNAFDVQMKVIGGLKEGFYYERLKEPEIKSPVNKGKKWEKEDIDKLLKLYNKLMKTHNNKSKTIKELSILFERGEFSISNIIKKYNS